MRFLFTLDGYEVITGKSATALHRKFRKDYIKNEREKNMLSRWIGWFNFNVKGFFDTETDHFHFSTPVNIESPITYEGGETFDTTLLDFVEDKERDFEDGKELKKQEEECPSPLIT